MFSFSIAAILVNLSSTPELTLARRVLLLREVEERDVRDVLDVTEFTEFLLDVERPVEESQAVTNVPAF